MKKLVALFLVICTLSCLMLVTGCNKKKGYDGNNFLTVEQATAEYGNPYRIVRDKVTIKIFVPRGSMNPHYEEMKMFKKLSEITNLELKFVEADTSSYTTLRSAA